MSREERARAATSRRARKGTPGGLMGSLEARALKVPASIMVPRLLLILAVVGLLAFGLAMVYSASSIKGLVSDNGDSTYFLTRQVFALAVGLVMMAVAAFVDYRLWARPPVLVLLVGGALFLLLAVFALGLASHGATRWISLGSLTLQPAELVKSIVIVLAAYCCNQLLGTGAWDNGKFLRGMAVVAVMVGLILAQPDKGTTLVLAVTLFCMLLAAGWEPRVLYMIGAGFVVAFLLWSLKDDYSRQRLLTMINPEADPYGDGYQLVQGFYAFGNGGLFGVGLGLGTQKYSYLPEMHNDFIFAVVGEELGVVGCLGVLALFGLLFWACWRIAEQAPDLEGRLIALGTGVLFLASVLLNVAGVLGVFPLSGKAIPFVSYGGSAMMGSLLAVGMVLSVSRASALPQTEPDRRRADFALVGAERQARRPSGRPSKAAPPAIEGSGAGAPVPRSFRLVSGGGPSSRQGTGALAAPARDEGRGRASREARDARDAGHRRRGGQDAHPEARVVRDRNGRERIELGRSSAERLRPSSGPEVRSRPDGAGRATRR